MFSKNLHRIDAEVYEFNKRSIKLLRYLGFKIEGLKREAHFDGKKYHNIVVLGLLKKDFDTKTNARYTNIRDCKSIN